MKNKKFITALGSLVVVVGGLLFVLQNCGVKTFDQSGGGQVPRRADDGFVQIERLGRPAVNEGLIISNDKLLAFNSIPPTLDLATDNPAVLAVLQEAATALGVVDALDGTAHFEAGFNSKVVAGFLPDVMRIDTTKNIPPGTAAYNGAFELVNGTAPILTGGRKPEDDVVDITLSYLVAGDPSGNSVKDNVTYQGVSGNIAQGHKKLHGQANYGGSATFPFLATAY